jgi:hypothetical protein
MEDDMITFTNGKYIVMTASAKMPNSCWGSYGRVAVIETNGTTPKMISKRARGVVRIVRTWERQHIGRTKRAAFQIACAEAVALAEQLNAGA